MTATPAPESATGNSHVPSSPLHDLMYGHLHACALRAVVVHEIPDHLAEGPLTAEQLAARSGTQAGPLHRVLRLLAVRGLFRQHSDGAFSLTGSGQALRADVPGSQRAAVLLFSDEIFRSSAAGIEATLRTGQPGFDAAYGLPFFAFLGTAPDKSRLFDAAMSSLTSGVNEKIVASYPFPDSGTVVDVAGGRGGLLREVLTRHRGLEGVLFDRPETVTGHLLDTPELTGRWSARGGDLFAAVPEGGDLYLLKNILHDFSDEDCARILGTLRRAVTPGTRLLVIDAVLPEDGAPHPAIALDIVMLMTLRGRERTAADFEGLLRRCGFRLDRILPTPSLTSIIEAAAV
ncbi:methyltransferase [Streptomyces sp. NPDC048270]|uniref:methyltransferase n=1 Tax=Streptomyces sp. NPDC048270 TaxID=3154615 RepID=UPI0033C64CC3